jgi:hypothetical protein
MGPELPSKSWYVVDRKLITVEELLVYGQHRIGVFDCKRTAKGIRIAGKQVTSLKSQWYCGISNWSSASQQVL